MQRSMKACYMLILWFWWGWSSIPKVSKLLSLQCLYNISKKKLQIKLSLCMQINIKMGKTSYKLASTLSALKFSTRWYYHSWSEWSSIPKVLKVTSLQYLYKISKKIGIELHFCMQINIKVSTSWYYRFWLSGQKCLKYPK